MPLVKNNHASSVLNKAVVLDLVDIRGQAEAILDAAHADAARVTREARIDAEHVNKGASQAGHEEGHAQGLKAGFEEGLEAGQKEGFDAAQATHSAELASLNDAWREALNEWQAQREMQCEEGRRDLLRLALGIAERIVMSMPKHDAEVAQRQVDTSIALLLDRTELRIRVNPADTAMLEEHLPMMLEAMNGASKASIESDESISRGGCIISTPDGDVDARLEGQLSHIARTLFPELSEEEL